MNRRNFLKLSAVTGVAIGASPLSGESDGSSAIPPQRKTQGPPDENWVATSCLNCPARCAIRVRKLNGKAVKITGNPLSLVSEGKVCPRAHIGLQVLYDPDRIRSPLKRTNREKGKGVDPKWIPISWNEALKELAQRLTLLRETHRPHKLLLFSGLNTVSSEDMIPDLQTLLELQILFQGMDWMLRRKNRVIGWQMDIILKRLMILITPIISWPLGPTCWNHASLCLDF